MASTLALALAIVEEICISLRRLLKAWAWIFDLQSLTIEAFVAYSKRRVSEFLGAVLLATPDHVHLSSVTRRQPAVIL